ncbi:tetratricopeptide repeat protein [Mycobacterium scrofulaceum]|uniref:Tetratricopeptide repeat protein n=1 Tax=Mycobacterium scrofulaceum TaxID=1783 RepID=A0A1X0KM21_MYCSC|nr:tetratricopeptide repeat protein [Mycobacterium scrofulaceum]ORB76290.1 hypothetical protein BST44_01875 [Mycobacterium scrofulaceum]
MTQPELPGPLAALTRLISERIAAADFAGALPLMNELVAVCRPVLGERHPNVLDMKLALVHLQLQMGDQAGAYAVLEQLVPEFQEVLGRDHITTLTARHMFADRPQQETRAALAEWSQLAADEERVLGPEHPTVLTSRDRVAHKLRELGDYPAAIAEGERVLAARRRVLGDDHEDTLGMRLSLAQWHGESVDGAGAVAQLEALVEVMREKLGEDHRHTLIARHTIALWEPEPEDYGDKVATWQALVDDEARVFGDDNPVTVAAREELAKWRDRVEEYRWVAEQISTQMGAAGSDDAGPSEGQAELAPDKVADAWVAEQELAFPEWVARFGGGQGWDFSNESLEAVADVVLHRCPTTADLDDPVNAGFTDGATWYLGEVLRRKDPHYWRWVAWGDHEPARADEYRVASKDTGDYPTSPRQKLNRLIETGNPLDLYHDGRYVEQEHPWPSGYFDNADTGPWTWTGDGWQCQLELWLNEVAARIATLSGEYLPADVALDYSAESLRRVEEFAIESTIEDPAFTCGLAAYIGETLLRAVGGRWLWDDDENSVTRGFPVVRPHLDNFKGTISPTHLLSFAFKWRDGATLTRVYLAQSQRVSARKAEDPTWQPMRSLTPGLDPVAEPAPDFCDTWRAEQQREFPNFVARYGPDETWDFGRDSLVALGEIVTELQKLPEGTPGNAKDCAAWYFGETLHRARPSRWAFNQYQHDVTGRIVDERPLSPWWISVTTHSRVGFAGHYPFQDIERPLRPGFGNTGWLRAAYDRWVTAEVRERVEEASKRRLSAKRRATRRFSDEEYLRCWLAERGAQFPVWAGHHGGEAVWDMSPESLDALEELVIQKAPTPEQLLDEEHNAPFVDGAVWYLGEVLRRGRALPWQYTGGGTADPTVGHVDVFEVLTGVLHSVERGALRRTYDRFAASR